YVYSLDEPISVPLDKNISFQAKPSKRNVNVNQIWTSIDGAPFVNTSTVTLTGTGKYGEHVFRAYVKGLNAIGDSLVVERVFTINPVLPPPVFTFDIVGGSATITGTSDFDILYSTDGSIPDLINRTNVAMYTKPLKITKKTIIKAVAVFEDQSSDIVKFPAFDPDTLFTTPTVLPIVTLSGSNSSDGYTSEVLITFESYSGVAYYTLDGTDPLDDKNLSRRVYVEPFNVLPIGNTKMYLNVGVIEEGKRSASTYNA
ncbi:MAG: chitobiase/beta-hexosaminidase C-terminal domain-containing protein, partial [Ignavibacteria bacterium]